MLTAIGAAVGAIVLPIVNACGETERREFIAIAHVDGPDSEMTSVTVHVSES